MSEQESNDHNGQDAPANGDGGSAESANPSEVPASASDGFPDEAKGEDVDEGEAEVISDDSEDGDEEVMDPVDKAEALESALAEEKEKYLRSLADMANLRKRCRRDIEDARLSGRMNVLEELLPALDSIDMALKSVEPTEANQAVYDGMIMVRKQFLASMSRFELKPVAAKGEKFDPVVHEAVSYVPSPDHDAGMIVEEMRSGYTLGSRLLRASMVVVSSGKPEGQPEETELPEDDAEEISRVETAADVDAETVSSSEDESVSSADAEDDTTAEAGPSESEPETLVDNPRKRSIPTSETETQIEGEGRGESTDRIEREGESSGQEEQADPVEDNTDG